MRSTAGSTSALWAWTPDATRAVLVEIRGGPTVKAQLYGPFPELRTSLKWFVAFFPETAEEVTITAFGQEGEVLWREDWRRITPPPEREFQPASDEVTVAQGTYEGGDWKVLVHRAIEVHSGTEQLCFLLELDPDEDPAGQVCTELGEASGGALGLDDDGDGPLPMVLYGYTSSDTARVEIAESGTVTEASLYPAPAELGMDMQFFVGFTDRKADVTVRAYDADGKELWTEAKPYHKD